MKFAGIILFGSFITLAGCGGGGGNESSSKVDQPAPEGPKATLETATVSLNESSVLTHPIKGIVSEVVTQRSATGVTATTSRNGVTIAASDLTNDVTARYKVLHNDGKQAYETTLTVNGINTSAGPLVSQAMRVSSMPTETLALSDEKRLAVVLAEIQYLATVISADEKDSLLSSVQTSIDEATATTESLKSALTTAINEYKAGQAGETTLAEKLSQMEGGIQEVGQIGKIVLDGMAPALNALGVALPADLPLTYDPSAGRYTRFTNDALGSYTDTGEWQFNPEYDWLNAALPMTTTNAN